jgi:hypothetical protein
MAAFLVGVASASPVDGAQLRQLWASAFMPTSKGQQAGGLTNRPGIELSGGSAGCAFHRFWPPDSTGFVQSCHASWPRSSGVRWPS